VASTAAKARIGEAGNGSRTRDNLLERQRWRLDRLPVQRLSLIGVEASRQLARDNTREVSKYRGVGRPMRALPMRSPKSSPTRCQRLSWMMIPVLNYTECADASELSATHLSAEPPMSFNSR